MADDGRPLICEVFPFLCVPNEVVREAGDAWKTIGTVLAIGVGLAGLVAVYFYFKGKEPTRFGGY